MVVLDGLQDPGNAGTIVRAAEAFGATGVLFLKGTVSPYNSEDAARFGGLALPRSLPARRGCRNWPAPRSQQNQRRALRRPCPAAAKTPVRCSTVDLTGRCALIIGNEAHGVSRELRAAAVDVTIPTVGVESLNAAVAAGILLYEARRQRMLRT